jgi:hypothetical protein
MSGQWIIVGSWWTEASHSFTPSERRLYHICWSTISTRLSQNLLAVVQSTRRSPEKASSNVLLLNPEPAITRTLLKIIIKLCPTPVHAFFSDRRLCLAAKSKSFSLQTLRCSVDLQDLSRIMLFAEDASPMISGRSKPFDKLMLQDEEFKREPVLTTPQCDQCEH